MRQEVKADFCSNFLAREALVELRSFDLRQTLLPFSSMTCMFLEAGWGERTDRGNLPAV